MVYFIYKLVLFDELWVWLIVRVMDVKMLTNEPKTFTDRLRKKRQSWTNYSKTDKITIFLLYFTFYPFFLLEFYFLNTGNPRIFP